MKKLFLPLFLLLFSFYSSFAQPTIVTSTSTNIAVNHWIKGWAYNPDGTVIIKYAVGVRNISGSTQCNLNILTDVIGSDAMADFAGSNVISVKQTAMKSISPSNCYNNGSGNSFTGDGDQNDITSGAYLKFNYLGGGSCCGDGCLCVGQVVEVCYNVVLDGIGLPSMPSKDNISSYVRARFGTVGDSDNNTDFSDPFNKNGNPASEAPTNNEGDNGDTETTKNIFETCSHLGIAQDIYINGVSGENSTITPASDGTYTFTWVYTMCNYVPNGSGLTGCSAKDIILKDSLEKYIGIVEDFEVTNITYSGGPLGGNLTSGVRSMVDINTDITAEVQPLKFIDGGFINSGGCDTLRVDILVTPLGNVNSHPCKNTFNSTYFRSTSPAICGKDDVANTTDCQSCDSSVRGTNPDSNNNGPGDNCNATRIRYSYINDIGLIKKVTNIEPNTAATPANGNLDITFEMTVKNTGNVDLNTLVLEDDVQTQLSSNCYVQIIGNPTVTNISATSAPSNNNTFTGIGSGISIDLLSGSATDLIEPNQEFKVTYILEVDPNNCASDPSTESNQATTKGIDPCARTVSDLSDDDSYFENDATAFVVSSALPVELMGFNAEVKNCLSILKWATASERDNAFFTVEHSTNAVDFREITQIKGKGNSTLVNLYNFKHEQPEKGQNYYRLKQVDLNGAFEYSKIITLNVKCVEYPLSIYPNPLNNNEQLILDYQNTSWEDELIITISDIQGNIVKSIRKEKIGNHSVEIDINALSTGMYFIKDNLGNFERLSIVNQ